MLSAAEVRVVLHAPRVPLERYRSGHNGPDSKSGIQQCIVGSNPTLSAKMNPTEPIKRLKFGFIFLCSKYGFKSLPSSKRDLNP